MGARQSVGINLGALAQKKGLKPLMGLAEARFKGQATMVKCPVCGDEPLSYQSQAMIHRYGQCSNCIKGEPQRLDNPGCPEGCPEP